MTANPMVAKCSRAALVAAAMAIGLSPHAALASSGQGARGGELRSEKFRTGTAPFIEVDNIYGAVAVEAGSPGEVSVEARISGAREGAGGSFRVEMESTASGIHVRSTCTGAGTRFAWCGRQRVDFVLRVPAESSLDLSGVGTDLSVNGIHGVLALSTVSGSIDVRDAGVVRAESESGWVRIDRAAAAQISAGEGNVELFRMRKGTVVYGEPDAGKELAAASDSESGSRSLVIRGTEALVRALLSAFHHHSCESGDC